MSIALCGTQDSTAGPAQCSISCHDSDTSQTLWVGRTNARGNFVIVLMTVDTEFWPSFAKWPDRLLPRPYSNIEADYAHCILGKSDEGEFGLPFMLQMLQRNSLRAVFFVESLFASALGS